MNTTALKTPLFPAACSYCEPSGNRASLKWGKELSEQERTSVLVLQCACQPPSMGRIKTVHNAKPGDELFCLTAVEKGLDFKWKWKQIKQTLLSHVEDSYPLEQLGEDSALAHNCLCSSTRW